MIDPTMSVPPGMEQQDTTDRRRALARLLMTPNVPMEAYRTPQGAAMGGAAQMISGLAGNNQFMKWLQGGFANPGGTAISDSTAAMSPLTGRAAGPV